MKNKTQYSKERIKYLNGIKKNKFIIIFWRFALLAIIFASWEILANAGVIDPFITSSPSRIVNTIRNLFINDNFSHHIATTLYETVLGFILAVGIGYAVALILWWSEKTRKVLEPYIVVLNSLPKIALGPVIIIWFGSGDRAIIFMAFIIGIVVAIMTMLNGFLAVDKNKILLLKSFGANKFQILLKLVIPGSMPSLISMLKISVGMAWIGSIMGEYLVSRAGLGYLIVYGGQVFKLDLVMASTVVLCIMATLMYVLVATLEKIIIKYKTE
nr:ABC transporter permease [Clostridia bacterium]